MVCYQWIFAPRNNPNSGMTYPFNTVHEGYWSANSWKLGAINNKEIVGVILSILSSSNRLDVGNIHSFLNGLKRRRRQRSWNGVNTSSETA